MIKDQIRARELLEKTDCTCVLCKFDTVIKSTDRGVAPLLALVREQKDLSGFSAADKVVGKAAAFLYCLLKVKSVYAPVISRAAYRVLQSHGIAAEYQVLADRILNRNHDGFCPMETAVETIESPQQALQAIEAAVKKLNH